MLIVTYTTPKKKKKRIDFLYKHKTSERKMGGKGLSYKNNILFWNITDEFS